MYGRGKGVQDNEDATRLDELALPSLNPSHHEHAERRNNEDEAVQADTVGLGSLFACPYFKRDPKRYSTSRTCVGPGWRSISRLKEHINRFHQAPAYYCSRRGTLFKMEALERHKHPKHPCVADDHTAIPGLAKTQQEALRLRKLPYRGASNTEKWHHIWGIIFPGEPLPSCIYYEYQECASPPVHKSELLETQGANTGFSDTIQALSNATELFAYGGPEIKAGEGQVTTPQQRTEAMFADQQSTESTSTESVFPELQTMLSEPCPPVSQPLPPELIMESSPGPMETLCLRPCAHPMALDHGMYLPRDVPPSSLPLLAMMPPPPSFPLLFLPEALPESCGTFDMYSIPGTRAWPLASLWDVWSIPHVQSRLGQNPGVIDQETRSILTQHLYDSRSGWMGGGAENWEQLLAACNNM